MKRLLLGLLCMFLSFAALAAAPDVAGKRVEGSLLVTGSIVVAADGRVSECAIDRPGELPPFVVDLVKKASATWRFAPIAVGGEPVNAKTKMSLRVVAKTQDDGNYAVSIRSAYFGGDDAPGTSIAEGRMSRPNYPKEAVDNQVSGTVYLAFLVNRQGNVEKVAAEQVNLASVDSNAHMDRWRRLFADAAVNAAQHWTFKLPTSGPDVHEDHWEVRIPVEFFMPDRPNPVNVPYGKWSAYIPGPVQSIPWFDKASQMSIDAIPAGQLAQVGSGRQLLTPVSGS